VALLKKSVVKWNFKFPRLLVWPLLKLSCQDSCNTVVKTVVSGKDSSKGCSIVKTEGRLIEEQLKTSGSTCSSSSKFSSKGSKVSSKCGEELLKSREHFQSKRLKVFDHIPLAQ
jgi:hypothetical protein